MWSSSRRALLLLPLLLAGCGFAPLHGRGGTPSGAGTELAGVSVRAETDRLHHMVRNELIERLNPRGERAARSYQLLFEVREARSAVLVTRQEAVTRYNLSMSASWRLIDSASGEELTRGNANSTASYNALRAEFANVASESDARHRAARDLAESLRLRLAAWFERRAN